MSLVSIRESAQLGRPSFQAVGRTRLVLTHKANIPKPQKGLGIYTYRGFDCLIIPSGERLAVIILNGGSPIPVEWTFGGKRRVDFSNASWAKLNTKKFINHHIRKKHVGVGKDGKPKFLERELKAVPFPAGNTPAPQRRIDETEG